MFDSNGFGRPPDFDKHFNRVSKAAVVLGVIGSLSGLALIGTVIYAVITLVNKV